MEIIKTLDDLLSPSQLARRKDFLDYTIKRVGGVKKKFKNVESYMRFARGKIKYPKMTELDYYRAILRKTERMISLVKQNIIPKIPTYIAMYKNEARIADGVMDQSPFLQQIENDLKSVASELSVTYSDQSVNSLVTEYATKINKSNKDGNQALGYAVLGINLFAAELWLETLADVWISNNVKLIKSIPEQYFSQLEYIIKDSIQAGRSMEDIQNTILQSVSFKPTERTIASKSGSRLINPISRSALIARDQVGKFFGQLSQYRQLDVGIEDFIWDAVMDERTRPSHAILNGKTFSWAKGADGIYPGMEYQCRCVSLPVFPGYDF